MNAPPNFTSHANFKAYEPPSDNDVVSEFSVARDFIEINGEDLKYCEKIGGWFRWDGLRWKPDLLSETFQEIRFFAQQCSENQAANRRVTAGKTGTIRGIETQAKTSRGVIQNEDWFDNEPMLLGTPAGVVDLATGELRPGRKEDRITKSTMVAPETGDCPIWLKFIREATQGDDDLIRLLRQWCGYCLTGKTIEHSLMFFSGPGGNGKGVFLNFMTELLGDYGGVANIQTFAASKSERHLTEIAALRGKRTVTASETTEGQAWDESRIKTLTGGDPIKARFMRQDEFVFMPQFKLMIMGNHKPILQSPDEAMRRRLMIIPFEYKPPVKDLTLGDKLRTEAAAVLQWMIDGCLDWQANGLLKPESVLAATAEYFSDQDVFQHWLDEECDAEPGNEYKSERATDLFKSWADFAKARGDSPGSARSFKDQMIRRGFRNKRMNTGAQYVGLRLRPTASYHHEE
ncbi:phage/plasmid primase, P4 family [Tardiphaga sp. 803_E3_N1_3]|uniref:phage/plasmid primase, P4 family n=1 Tax=Tardiphaga sp. 803_E3_N1_3 TaxID=3240785 RepID=UPI003F246933